MRRQLVTPQLQGLAKPRAQAWSLVPDSVSAALPGPNVVDDSALGRHRPDPLPLSPSEWRTLAVLSKWIKRVKLKEIRRGYGLPSRGTPWCVRVCPRSTRERAANLKKTLPAVD